MTVSIKPHATALVSAISVSLVALGCAKSEPPTVLMIPNEADAATEPPVVAAPIASASPPTIQAPAEPRSSAVPPAPPASSAATPSSAKAPSPPKRKPAPTTVEGRPFLVENEARVAALGRGDEWNGVVDFDDATMTPVERAALIAHFTQWSLAEHASIASFARFGLQLLGLGAPPSLLLETTAAMQDEIRHARFGFGVLAALGSPTAPQGLPIDGALEGDLSLAHVLRLCVREGMIGETLAALELVVSADLARLPRLKKELASIGADEARHAQLAYSFAAWALQRDPALIGVIDEEVSAWECASAPTAEGLEQWGIVGAADRRAIQRDGFDLAVRPLIRKLRDLAAPRDTSRELERSI